MNKIELQELIELRDMFNESYPELFRYRDYKRKMGSHKNDMIACCAFLIILVIEFLIVLYRGLLFLYLFIAAFIGIFLMAWQLIKHISAYRKYENWLILNEDKVFQRIELLEEKLQILPLKYQSEFGVNFIADMLENEKTDTLKEACEKCDEQLKIQKNYMLLEIRPFQEIISIICE